ncbi:hypothetical protein LIER_31894 [Lithospermum erythrorhizon]|uniref:Reverse transcriptase Ty1/copia-type domain-containing protein n=1 Tax=Lithospermum erythrorhizon TaxID=34254 RepID=A0AAV3RXM0_LITER
MKDVNSSKWFVAMKDELKSMESNQVWQLVQLPPRKKEVGCFEHKESIDYCTTFSPVSTKDSLRIVMELVAHYDLELYQIDVKTAALNGDLEEEV